MAMAIRDQVSSDADRIREINRAAFPETGGAKAFYRIREAGRSDVISLVAEVDGSVAGHILFTPVHIERDGGTLDGMGLAELAVDPRFQRQGVGRALTDEGVRRLRTTGCPYVIVVGVPEYYPRLGFQKSSAHGLQCQWQGIPDEAFMVLVLDPEALSGVTGVAAYTDKF